MNSFKVRNIIRNLSDSNCKIATILFVLFATLLMSIPASFEINHFAKTLFCGAFAVSLAMSIVLAWITQNNLIVRKICMYVLMFLFTVETYIFICYGSRFDPNILTLILQTNTSEVIEFFKVYLLSVKSLIVIAFIIICCLLVAKLLSTRGSIKIFKPLPVKIVLLAVVIVGFYLPFAPLPFPIGNNTLIQFCQTWNFVIDKHSEVDKMSAALDNIKIYNSPSVEKAPVVVLIIGESFNKHHSSLYGYTLPTSPNLEKEKICGNLQVFTNVETPTNGTAFAMRYIFSLKGCRAERSDSSQYVLMPAVFKKAGYKVAYFDNQYTRSTGGSLDYSCGYFLNPVYINNNCFNYRNDQLSQYDGDFIKSYKHKMFINPKSFDIIHLKGQHFDAQLRYPSDFEYFKSQDIKRKELTESQKKQVAAYDNATRYNDYVIFQIINIFRKTDAVIVYLSDHGEQIYDGKKLNFGRGYPSDDPETARNVYEVPFMVWCSDAFIRNHPQKYSAICQAKSRMICSSDVAYMLFDLADINFNYNSQKHDALCSYFVPHRVLKD